MREPAYLKIVSHYEDCLKRHHDGALAVDWKSERDANIRYDVMLGVVRNGDPRATLLDFGCGLAALKSHMENRGMSALQYTGLDISQKFACSARALHPDTEFLCYDVLESHMRLPSFDYVIMNGVFTRRHDMSANDMESYLHRLLGVVFEACGVGLAFNVMSKAVDWECKCLFHPDPGRLIDFISRKLTRHFIVRNDYGLYETTYYLYREPCSDEAIKATT